jgi:hypothetical protein
MKSPEQRIPHGKIEAMVVQCPMRSTKRAVDEAASLKGRRCVSGRC